MSITAPFRFARINRKVWFPSWAEQVSHDVPFADGLCGTIKLNIKTVTPLLVGGEHEKGEPGAIHPFVDDLGHWAIPGSSIQGTIRQILEVAAFGKLGPVVHDRRFGVRDLSAQSETANQLYKSRVTAGAGTQAAPFKAPAQSGWLRRRAGGIEIVRCDHTRIHCDDIVAYAKGASGLKRTLHDDTDAKQRLEEFIRAQGDATGKDVARLNVRLSPGSAVAQEHKRKNRDGTIRYFYIHYAKGAFDPAGTPGTLVMTGKPSAGYGTGNKKREFAFYNPDASTALTAPVTHDVPDDVWRDFLLIHAPEKGSGAPKNPNWAFWEGEFLAGRPVPVFFIEEAGAVSALGMAQMFKLAMQLSTHQMLQNSSPDHVDRAKFDLPALIFGATGDGSDAKDNWYAHNLKRRAAFDLFRAVDPPAVARDAERKDDWQVMLAPKPSYYPIYVRQSKNTNELPGKPSRQTDRRGKPIPYPYAAYHEMQAKGLKHLASPELAGTKIWPVRRRPEPQPQPERDKQGELRKIANHLRSVPAGQAFTGALRVHNLRPIELGAVLWALTFGKEGQFTHRLGGAKPLGFGEVAISLEGMELIPNDPNCTAAPDAQTLIRAFTDEMERFHGDTWVKSPQVQALIRAAQPGTAGLAYLTGHEGYKTARGANQVMAAYVDEAAELPRTLPAAPASIQRNAAPPRPPSGNWPKVEDAPVRHHDGREGIIREVMRGACQIRVDGNLDYWSDAEFVVTGPPEDE